MRAAAVRDTRDPAPHVLVAGSDPGARARVAAFVGQALPGARIEEFSGVSDLVFRVAGMDIDLILLEAQTSTPWPAGLASLLKGVTPGLRLATVASAPLAPKLMGSDASLTETSLSAWLLHPSREWQ